MKTTSSLIFIILLGCVLTGNIVFEQNIALAQPSYSIEIIEKNYTINRTEPSGQLNIVYFDIAINLQNTGNEQSDNITIEITDEDGITLHRNYTFTAGEIHTFTFNNHPLFGMKEHRINISYYPTFPQVAKTIYNNGNTSLILLEGNNPNSTPGFETILFLFIIVTYFFIKKIKK